MRILFYASNGLGVGHLTRLLSVAHAIVRLEPSHEIAFITNSEAGPFPDETPFYAIRIPGRSRARMGKLTPKSYFQSSRPLILQAVASFDPHVLVTDTFPEGPERELLPVMEWPIRKAFLFREQNPERWPSDGYAQALRPYQKILVPHEEGSVFLPRAFGDDPRIRWVGPVVYPSPIHTREHARERLGIGHGETAILLSFGGGGDPHAFRRAHDSAVFLRKKGISVFHAPGPLSRDLPPGITAREWLPLWPVKPWLRGFDGVIAAGGYNTVHEILEAGVPALFVPFERALDSQDQRIDRLVKDGMGLKAQVSDAESFEGSIESFMASRTEIRNMLHRQPSGPFQGAENAGKEIMELGPQR
jgi:UDP-N-acetylglucosamine--N-acetylmuramyl-(pentapeptide) pyrophosphoryl-undecaprenol N-acetylglucosamine transferase